jgi:hypothetical protein
MNKLRVSQKPLSYSQLNILVEQDEPQGMIVRRLARHNRFNPRPISFNFPVIETDSFKDSRAILLSQFGALKDDDTLDELLENIYKARGRSMTE